MRKRKRFSGELLMMSVVVLVSWFALVLNVHADYRIDNYHVKVDVQKDGSAQVTQTMRYDFDDDYHGVFNVQDLRGIQGAKLEKVTTRLNGGSLQTARKSDAESNNTYQLTQNAERMRVKLYQRTRNNDKLQVRYQYRLYGVVTNYADTAELNWRVIGSGWDVALHGVKVTIQLPAKDVGKLQAWTHGPLSGYTTVDRKLGRVTMTVNRNPAKQFVESHLVFPTSVTASNQKTSSKKRLAAVQKQEAQLAKQANQKRQRARLLNQLVVGLAGLVWLVLVVSYIWWFHNHPANRHQQPIPINHSFDVPTVAPAVAQALLENKSPDTKGLTGEILRAAAEHELQITTETGRRKPVVVLTKLKPISNSFLAHCFTTVAPDGVLSLSALKAYGDRDKKGRMRSWFGNWQREVDEAVAPFQDETNYNIRKQSLSSAIIVTIAGVIASGLGFFISPVLAAMMGGVALVVAITFWIAWALRRQRVVFNTDEGLQQINQISGLRRTLKDIGHFNTAEVGDLILWEQLLPYAAAFGLANKVTAQLAVDFGTEALAAGLVIYYPLFYGNGGANFDFSDIIDHSFSGAIGASDSASSPSGGSGGFSGGSSGGFGGGSGGGAF